MNRKSLMFALVALGAIGSLLAQDPNSDPGPGRGVARISVLNGDVSVRRGDSNDVVAAALNAPLVVQDALLTSSSSRAELQFDSSNILRVGSNAEVRMAGIDNNNYQIQVATGTVTFTTLRAGNSRVELDTPSVSIRPTKPGAYRVTVREDGTTEVTVRAGEAEIYSPRGSEHLGQGQSMLARGNPSDPEFQVVEAPAVDSWDRWNDERDRYIGQARSRRYVSGDIYGAEDLDQYGHWVNDPSYGSVWAPTVAPGWAPYREGRWVWEDFYGWTWVSYDPWGWAPYHYGRWFNGPAGWCWYPGPLYARSYWSPAIVGFFGFGGGGGFGFGFGNIGWVPLAPFEVFHPWWGRGFGGGFGFGRGFNNTTIVNNVNITNVYRNARVNGGMTGVGTAGFGQHNAQFAPVNGAQIGQAGMVRGMAPVTPGRASLQFSNRQANTAGLPQARNQNFFSHSQPAAVQRTPFAQQQNAMAQRFGEPTGGRVNGGNISTPNPAGFGRSAGLGAQPAPQGSSATGSHQWSRFGEPIHGTGPGFGGVTPQSNFGAGRTQSPGAEPSRSTGSSNGGWRTFGAPSGSSPSQRPMTPRGFGGPQNVAPQNPGSGNSQRFDTPNSVNPAPRSNFAPGPSSPGFGGSRGGWSSGSGGSAPVRIAPPMVQRAPQQSFGGGRGFSAPPSQPRFETPQQSFGGGRGFSAPPSQPRFEAPRGGGGGGGFRPAPSNSGGGGGSRGGGGFSGGGRSSGGHSGGGGNGGGGHHGH